jgi:ABC-type transport system substrate-binding protein
VLVVVLCVPVLASCADGPGSPTSGTDGDALARGGRVTYGLSLSIDGFNPVSNQWNSSNLNVGKAIFDPIAVLTEEGVAVPYLVESIEPNHDFTRWTMTARDGVRFHNGDPLTALELATHLRNVAAGPLTSFAMRPISSIDVVDEIERRQVVITMSSPWSTFPAFLAGLQAGFVAHPDFEAGLVDDPIGTGPFVLDEWVPGDHATVVRNESYWRAGLPYLDEIRFELLLDPTTRLAALEAGDVDMINTEALNQVVELSSDEATQERYQFVDDSSDGDEMTVLLNTQSGPTADLRVRRALALATDRAALNNSIYRGFYELADAPFRGDSRWYRDPGWPEPDLAGARELVEDWEAENGSLEIELTVLSGSDYAELGQALAAQWGRASIDVSINAVDATQAGTTAAFGQYEAFIFAFFFGTDPDEHYPFWDPDPANIGGPGEISINFTRYTSSTVERVLQGARTTDDPDARAELYGELWRDFAENVPYVWLLHVDWIIVADPQIRGLESFTRPSGDQAAAHVWGSLFLTEAWTSP